MEERPRVLIVDDNQGTRILLELALSHQGFQVFSAPSGTSALLQLRVVQPDLIILDILMPGIDGWDTLEQIRAFSNIPIIVLTALDDPNVKKKSLAQGANACLTKPLNLRDLRAQASALVQRSKASEAE
jgi:DNA-binding response OmpR family regulator